MKQVKKFSKHNALMAWRALRTAKRVLCDQLIRSPRRARPERVAARGLVHWGTGFFSMTRCRSSFRWRGGPRDLGPRCQSEFLWRLPHQASARRKHAMPSIPNSRRLRPWPGGNRCLFITAEGPVHARRGSSGTSDGSPDGRSGTIFSLLAGRAGRAKRVVQFSNGLAGQLANPIRDLPDPTRVRRWVDRKEITDRPRNPNHLVVCVGGGVWGGERSGPAESEYGIKGHVNTRNEEP